MIFALGTPVNARCRPWTYDWALKPDALMISAIDFMKSPTTFKKVRRTGIHEFLGWDGQIICDSGAFSALNSKKGIIFDMEKLKEIYTELTKEDPKIIKITLDYPDDKIIENYMALSSLEVQPVIPHEKIELFMDVLSEGIPEWTFIGRLVPLMRRGGGHANRLFPVLDKFKKYIQDLALEKNTKLWALGVGAPSLILEMAKKIDGCDSARWRITGSNMVLLPRGGERGVSNLTKWRGTHHRINESFEKDIVIKILKEIDDRSGGLEYLDDLLLPDREPKQLKTKKENNLPTIGALLEKLREKKNHVSVYDLELLLRTSGNLRLIFNYWAALSYKTSEYSIGESKKSKPVTLDSILESE